MLRIEVGFDGFARPRALGEAASGPAIPDRFVPGTSGRAATESVSPSHSSQSTPEQDAENARSNGQEFPVRRREFLAFEFKGRAVLVQTHLYFTANYFLIRYYAPWLYSRINS
jgi:hypothetical protein